MYREDIPFVTLFGTPVATAALWYLGHLTLATNQALVGVAIWLCWQRFSAAGHRIPGRKRVGPKDAAGKVAIVTGANTGIGFWTAVGLVEAGAATVVVTCRDETKVKDTIAAVRAAADKPQADVRGIVLELGSFKKVKAAADAFKALKLPLHILINNAGAAISPENGVDKLTEDTLEVGFQGNFVSPILFTELLIPLLLATRGRVVNVASRGHEFVKPRQIKPLLAAHPKLASVEPGNDYVIGFRTYCLTKLGNVYHAQWLAKEYPEITAVSLHPGGVLTDVWRPFKVFVDRGIIGITIRAFMSLFFKTSAEGAVTSIHCAIADGIQTGKYYVDEAIVPTARHASKAEFQDAMMSLAFAYVKPYLN